MQIITLLFKYFHNLGFDLSFLISYRILEYVIINRVIWFLEENFQDDGGASNAYTNATPFIVVYLLSNAPENSWAVRQERKVINYSDGSSNQM